MKFRMTVLAVSGVLALGLMFSFPAQAQNGGAPGPHFAGGQQDAGGAFADPQQRQALRDQLMKLPPDQRRAKMHELRQQFQQQRDQKLDERKQKFQERWSKASPEQRQKFCSNVAQRCSGDSSSRPACQFAQSTCAGNK